MSTIMSIVLFYIFFCAVMEIVRIYFNPLSEWSSLAKILMFPITLFWLCYDIAMEAANVSKN